MLPLCICVVMPAISICAGLIRVVIVGDVHGDWHSDEDEAALELLRPDATIFLGDFGEERLDIVKSIAAEAVPRAVILGNHDAW